MRLFTCLLLWALALPSCASSQIPDKILVDGEMYYFLSGSDQPLDSKFSKESIMSIRDRAYQGKGPNPLCTGNWRGYVATWEASDNRLLLKEVNWDGCGDKPNLEPLSTFFPGHGSPVEATWYSGTIRIGKGELIQCREGESGCTRYYGGYFRHASYLELKINKGRISSRGDYDPNDPPRPVVSAEISCFLEAIVCGQEKAELQRKLQLATERLKQLEADPRPETELWDSVKAASDSATIQGYLDRYPTGRYVAAAQVKLAAMKRTEARRRPHKVFKDCDGCPEMVVIPAGSFEMGSPQLEGGRDAGEATVHRVNVKRFAMGQFEVTRGQYAAFVSASGYLPESKCYTFEAGKYDERSGRSWQSPGFAQNDNHPVVCVHWRDAKAYTAWLSRKTGKIYRLPSEEEWEYAARAGTTTARHWGDNPDQACGYANVGDMTAKIDATRVGEIHNCNDGQTYTANVGTYTPNDFGLHDMIGNAEEWMEKDCRKYDFKGAPSDWCGNLGELRGGSWESGPRGARSATRLTLESALRFNFVGFRLARELR